MQRYGSARRAVCRRCRGLCRLACGVKDTARNLAANEQLKFNGTPGSIKLNFINRAGRAQRAAMKFYKAAAQQNIRGLNLKFYPTQVGGADCPIA
ncbi:hypothetical protein [Campylobacter gracilis]|uniref:hypothetical protein n=1 Tax=Campylobacter gracilis TaxID=824 RepID=UPI000590F2CA|nr:hypothetical protein [Campylobacter gracilis]